MTVRHPDPSEREVAPSLRVAWRIYRNEWQELWGMVSWPSGSQDYDQAFASLPSRLAARSQGALLERERLAGLLERLHSCPSEERKTLVLTGEEFRSWRFCEWLIESCHDLVYLDLAQAAERADSAISLAEKLSPQIHGAALINDLKARAWAGVGETLRVLSDLRSAQEAFSIAEDFLVQGTGDLLEEARILELKAALFRDQRRTADSHRLLAEVIAVYRQYRDSHLIGRAFIQKGRAYGIVQDLEPAVHCLRKGLGLLDSSRDRRFELAARHSLMLYLHESGRHWDARILLTSSASEFAQHGGELLSLRLRWLAGKIEACLGFLEEAEKALLEARQGLIRLGVGFSAAAVCLDLAALYASQGRAAEMRRLAEEMLPVFQSRDLHREAIAALITFQQAVEVEKVSASLLTGLRSYLDRAPVEPGLRFEIP